MQHKEVTNNQKLYDEHFNKEMLPSKCLLCLEGELHEHGHIIPKFVMRWLKKASGLDSLHFNGTEEKTSDTIALRILCKHCEDKFDKHERQFTEGYFKPYYRGISPKSAKREIYSFALSIAWRILAITPFIKGSEKSETYCRILKDTISPHFFNPEKKVEVDVHIFSIDEVLKNIPPEQLNEKLLKFSISQGVFAHNLFMHPGFKVTLQPLPIVHFKIGAYYFIVALQDHIKNLEFDKKLQSTRESNVYSLQYTKELVGFLRYISYPIFEEVAENALPNDVNYDVISISTR